MMALSSCSSSGPAASIPSRSTPRLSSPPRRGSPTSKRTSRTLRAAVALVLSSSLPAAMAQNCFSLAGSSTCPGFGDVQVTPTLGGNQLYSFLGSVTDTTSFDTQLSQFISAGYTRSKYQDTLGCSDVNLTDTSNLYARYTTSVICNAVIQASASICTPNQDLPAPLCAASCATFAMSEQEIVASPSLCGTAGSNANDLIRADFVTCSAPDESLRNGCIMAYTNEPTDCGYGANLPGLCGYCGASSPNATDSCCVNSNVESRCQGVVLPTQTSMAPIFSSTATSSPTASSSAAPSNTDNRGLSGGQIAGIVVGSILGALFFLALIILAGVLMRRKRQSQAGSIFNQPSPARQGSDRQMAYDDGAHGEVVPGLAPGGRVARMTALESASGSSNQSSLKGSPTRRMAALGGAAPPRRAGSLSSNSQLMLGDDPSSPQASSGGELLSSPEGTGSGQSEQLDSFKDYYSQDDIHPQDTVATLWAYQPRAADEFELERGDMLKIVGIWDDGWATGVKLNEQAEDWERRRDEQRDSGVSNGSARVKVHPINGDIKAFPLVCVCLPQHWRKTIEGDTTTAEGSGSRDGGVPPPPSPPRFNI